MNPNPKFTKIFFLLMITAVFFSFFRQSTTASFPTGGTIPTRTPSLASFLPVLERPENTPTPTETATPTLTPTATATVTPTVTLNSPPWLQYVNQFRAQANLPALTESSDWSYGGGLHGRYMVKEVVISHTEDPTSPWYTDEGNAAGQNGNIAVSGYATAPDEYAIDIWMSGAFHAVAILDPQLQQTGFGSYREAVSTSWKMGATLDVKRGLGDVPPAVSFPVFFPQDGGFTWLTAYNGNEFPNPLASCPGYVAPSGPPILLQLGSGNLSPTVTDHSFSQGDTPLEHCIFNETTYTNPNINDQNSARIILNLRDAVVLMPRWPLSLGEAYTVSITADGSTYTWSFSVVSSPVLYHVPETAEYEIR